MSRARQWDYIRAQDRRRRVNPELPVLGGRGPAREIAVNRSCLDCHGPLEHAGLPVCTFCEAKFSSSLRLEMWGQYEANRPMTTRVKGRILREIRKRT